MNGKRSMYMRIASLFAHHSLQNIKRSLRMVPRIRNGKHSVRLVNNRKKIIFIEDCQFFLPAISFVFFVIVCSSSHTTMSFLLKCIIKVLLSSIKEIAKNDPLRFFRYAPFSSTSRISLFVKRKQCCFSGNIKRYTITVSYQLFQRYFIFKCN